MSIHRLELAEHNSLELYFRRDSSVRQLWNEVAEIHQVATYTPGGQWEFIAECVAFHVYYRVFAMLLDGHFKKKLWRSLEPKYNPQRAMIGNEIVTLGKYHGSSVT